MESLAREYCAFTAAIVLVLYPIVDELVKGQLSPESLATAVNNSHFGGSPDFAVNPLALHQGFHLYKKSVRLLGHGLIQMGSKEIPTVAAFLGLREAQIGWDIIFFKADLPTGRSNPELLVEIKSKAHSFMNLKGFIAQHSSLSEISAILWQRQLPTCRPPPIIPKEPETVTHKRRKSCDELSERQLTNCGKQVMNMVSSMMCVNNEDPLGYLIAALKETGNTPDSVSKALYPESSSVTGLDITYEKVYSDFRVIAPVTALPNKYITFSHEEKKEVLKVFDIVHGILSEIDGNHHQRINYHASLLTKNVLVSLAGYSDLIASSIERWNLNRDKVLEKTGRKINSDFEASVWGKLMICEYEKRMVIIFFVS